MGKHNNQKMVAVRGSPCVLTALILILNTCVSLLILYFLQIYGNIFLFLVNCRDVFINL
jgi:hypothetical protein